MVYSHHTTFVEVFVDASAATKPNTLHFISIIVINNVLISLNLLSLKCVICFSAKRGHTTRVNGVDLPG